MNIVAPQFDTEKLMQNTAIVEAPKSPPEQTGAANVMASIVEAAKRGRAVDLRTDRPYNKLPLKLADAEEIKLPKDFALTLHVQQQRLEQNHVAIVTKNLNEVEAEELPADDQLMPADFLFAAGRAKPL